ncbi:hypothetical protein GQ53DRAFT_108458 [Thozetella sp. PMI_491]|nr:hypothetical protein GQ53DRAFT_108458 [Thozetella sp. PMI_491]
MASRSGGSSSTVLLEAPAPSSYHADTIAVPVVSNVETRILGTSDRPTTGNGESAALSTGPVDPAGPTPSLAQRQPAGAIALTMMSLALSNLLSALDLTLVTTALPSIAADFKAASGYIWIGSSFILAYTAITPVWGSVADIWGRKPIVLLALALFIAGSLLCAVAPTMDLLIGGRAVQGLGASGMGVMGNIIISDLFSLRNRGLYLGLMSIVWAVGTAIGPVIGGALTTKLNWRWCFWINLPVGVVTFAALFVFLKVPNPRTPVMVGLRAIDWIGSVLVIGGALMILLGLDFADVAYPWASAPVISLIICGAVVLGLFLGNEWKLARNPILPLRLFKTVSTSAAVGVLSCNFYVFIGLSYYLPLYSQSVLGADALTAGVYMLPLIVSSSLAAAAGGVLIQQTGKYLPIMYVAQVLLTLGVGLFINLGFEKNITKLVIFEIITGVGVGLNIEAPTISALANTPERDNAAMIASMTFLRSMATAISVVVGGVIFQNEMTASDTSLVGRLEEELASQFNGAQAAANVDLISTLPADQQDVVRRAYFSSLRSVWVMYVAFAGLSTFLNLFVRAHHLSKERQEVVLGVDRLEPEARQTASEVGPDAVELRPRRRQEQS